MRKPKSIQGDTKMPINQCGRLRTLACFLSMAGGENPLLGGFLAKPSYNCESKTQNSRTLAEFGGGTAVGLCEGSATYLPWTQSA